ncbi:TnsA endonuclease N-terminal domain-containing protein [Marinisporobacter balticus]|uniref:TnsA endonuclease-like protein n=1 Tax=Marinisporobacter balticus TaxID=2018667 RepID=A0A4R2KM45_9FIRM|nr:TnsA endonuclease N-terminal domain-containing protein [Marinisporobacter balticus]TCO71809.1 TnsA endonuclease-like protein [Marinisporobacter balticus]
MSKRKRYINRERIERLIKKGRGQGIEEAYKPWLLIQDVPSAGRESRLVGIKINRQYDFLSDLEKNYFYILDFADEIIDIREQFPLLPVEETILIADELGIKHPTDPKTNEYIVMTTDFLVTQRLDGKNIDMARTIKPSEQLMNERVIEKFEIERRYWEKQGIDWGIVTEKEINNTIAKNISYIYSYYHIDEIDSLKELDKEYIGDILVEYIRRVIDSKESIRSISSQFDKDLFLAAGTGISIFKHLLIRKILKIDLSQPLDINKVMKVELSREELNKEMNIS